MPQVTPNPNDTSLDNAGGTTAGDHGSAHDGDQYVGQNPATPVGYDPNTPMGDGSGGNTANNPLTGMPGYQSNSVYTPGGTVLKTETMQDGGKLYNVPVAARPGYTDPVAQGSGVAQGQQTYQAGGFAQPDISSDNWTPGGAFNDPNANNIYEVINSGINGRANQLAPGAYNTQLGQASALGPVGYSGAANLSPQMMLSGANLNTAQDQQYAAAQNTAINALAAQASGQGPSVATTQAHQLAQQNIAGQMAMLGSQRGSSNPAQAQRTALTNAAQLNQSAAATGALGRSQEALTAGQQLQTALGGARTQSQATSATQAQLQQQAMLADQATGLTASGQNATMAQNAGLANVQGYNAAALQQAQLQQQQTLQQGTMNQQTNLANLTGAEQQNQLNDQEYGQMLQAYMTQNQNDISNSGAYQQLLANEQVQKYGVDANVSINNTNNAMGLVGSAMQAAGVIGGALASDRRVKKSVKSAADSIREFLDLFNMGLVNV